MARFVVLEAQRHFIKNGLSVLDLELYFIPAMSPTLFFADARGLPFVQNGEEYTKAEAPLPNATKVRETVNKICDFLTIPKFHDYMATRPSNSTLTIDLIQNQANSRAPVYGIDANRDCYNVLKSTQAFNSFIISLGLTSGNSTVILMHGHENASNPGGRTTVATGNNQGTVLAPYKIKPNTENKGIELTDTIKNYADYMTAALFGYMYSGEAENYVFGGEGIKYIKEDGEWVRKLYVDQGSPEIPCFDIELGENYRDGTRGNTDPKVFDGRYKMYEADKVANRHQKGLPFYTKDASGVISGRFAIVSLQEPHMILSDKTLLSKTIPFYEFLEKYFKERDNWKFPDEEKK
jgi:hypothetical protein